LEDERLLFTPMSPSEKIYFILGFRAFLMLGTPLSAAVGHDSKDAHPSFEIALTNPHLSWQVFVENIGGNKFAKAGYRRRYVDQQSLQRNAPLPKCI
jgi:hypothetical protein